MPWFNRGRGRASSIGGPSISWELDSVERALKKGVYELTADGASKFVSDIDYSERTIAKLRRLGFRGRIVAPNNLTGMWHGQCLYRFPRE